MSELRVKRLAIYPVKSLGQVIRQQLLLDEMGAVDDRRFMLVDENGLFISQRTCPDMALIKVLEQAGHYVLQRPDGSVCPLPRMLETDKTYSDVELADGEIWGDKVRVPLVGGDVTQWLQDTLKKNCRLLYIPKQRARVLGKKYVPEQALVGFADRYPFLLTASASLEDFNTHLQSPITMQRFRPNIEIEGSKPWAEDGWRRLQIGEVIFCVAAPSARCQVPSIDPNTGIRQPEVSQALAQHRRRDGKIWFGQNLIQENFSEQSPGVIAVGDRVQVLE